ncbi:MAG: phosphatidate cytidylyltransferase [bacterium]
MGKRVLTAIIFIPVVLLLVRTGGLPFFIFIAAVALLAQNEFYAVTGDAQITPKRLVCLFAGFLILFSAYLRTTDMLLSSQKGILAFALTFSLILLIMIHLLHKNIRYFLESIGVSLAGIFMVPWLASYLILIRDIAPHGREYFLLLLLGIWFVDTAAYVLGTKFGSRKLAKTISPKKTIVGFAAGILAGLAFAFIWKLAVKIEFIMTYDIIVFGLITGVVGQIGDLVESMFKRTNLVKDTGAIFPGHGGAYDRIDSLIFAAPFLYYYLVVFIK